MGARAARLTRRFWNSDFRKRRISWTRFREKRLTRRGFLSFDRNARLRTYVYLAIGAGYFLSHRAWLATRPGSVQSLVRIACFAIEEASLPRAVYYVMRYERAMQVCALRDALAARYDANDDGRIGPPEARALTAETGLAPRDLMVSCTEGDLGKLLAASYRRHILPNRITREVKDAYELPPAALARALRRANYRKGLAEYEGQRAAMWAEADPYLTTPYLTTRYAEPGDYLKWETWRRGGERFYFTGKYLLIYVRFYVVHWLTHPGETYSDPGPG